MNKKNKLSNFWIRLLARVCDLIFVCLISSFWFIFIETQNIKLIFQKYNWIYYLWSLQFVFIIIIWFLIIPFFSGYTFFMWIFKIKIIFLKKQKFISIIKRELFFSISWIFMILLIMIVINHTLITKFILNDLQKINNNWEKFRISFVLGCNNIIIFIQFICAISIIIKKSKTGIHDNFSNTKTIWKNKFILNEKYEKIKKQIVIKPKKNNNYPVKWI